MTLLDFIEGIDDIIDLSSDEEAGQLDHNATQPHATLQCRQAVFILAGGERQDEQAAFVSAMEGSQEANESGNALVATAWPLVMERVSLDTAEPKNCPNSPTSAPPPSLTFTTQKVVTSEVDNTHLVATASPSVMKEVPLDTTELKNCPISPRTAAFPSPASTTPKDLTLEVGDAQLVATASPSAIEKVPLDTAESKNSSSLPTSAPLRGPASTTPKDLTSEVCETQLLATSSPSGMEKAPRDMAEFKNSSSSSISAPLPSPASTTLKDLTSEVGDTQLVATAPPSVMEKVPLGTAESKNSSGSPTSAPLPSPACTTLKAVTSEVGDAKLVRLKHPKKYQSSTPRRSPRFQQKRECCDSPVEEPAADHKRSCMLEAAQESASSADNAGSTKTISTEY